MTQMSDVQPVPESPVMSAVALAEHAAERTVEEIQAEIAVAADRLESLAGELALASLMTTLECDHFPPEAQELERMGTDEVCPSVALEAHGDLADAIEALDEAVDSLRKAAGRTAATVRAAWRERLLAKIEDPAARQLLRVLSS